MSKPTPAVIKVLREAKFFGDLVERDGKIYSRRSEKPFCAKATVDALVERGWLQRWRKSYVVTNVGKFAERDLA